MSTTASRTGAAPGIVQPYSGEDSLCSTPYTAGSDFDITSETEAPRACQKLGERIFHFKYVKRSQVLAIPHREEDEEPETHATTSICSFPRMAFVQPCARFFEEEDFSDCDDFRSTTGSEDDIAERLMFRSDDDED